MKISVNGVDLFELTDIQELIIQNSMPNELFDEDMKRRLQWVLMHKCEECCLELRAEWDSKLKSNGIKMIPIDDYEYAKLVFSQPNYKNRSQRDKEAGSR